MLASFAMAMAMATQAHADYSYLMETRRSFLSAASASGLLAACSLTGCGRAISRGNEAAPNNMRIETVAGPIEPEKLGFTLTHEHICRNATEAYGDRATALNAAISKVAEARRAGIDTIVDATPFDVDRDVRFGREVSDATGMHIVAATGQRLYAVEELERSLEQVRDRFLSELTDGIDGTKIKAGVIKIASTGQALTEAEEIRFRAAAQASMSTGVPIITHSSAHLQGGKSQAEVFQDEGVDPNRVVIGHSNDTDDFAYLSSLAESGFTLGMDHMFWGDRPGATLPSEARADIIYELCRAGHAQRIVLSNDWVLGDFDRDKVNPDGLLYTSRKTIPYLRGKGLTEAQIRQMTVDNPRRLLTSPAPV
jgi:phosphotriesterase-related protein